MGDEVFDVESAASSLVGPDDSDDEAVVVAVVEDQAGSNEVDRAVDFAYVIKSTPSRRTRLNMPSVKPRCGGRMHTNGLLETPACYDVHQEPSRRKRRSSGRGLFANALVQYIRFG